MREPFEAEACSGKKVAVLDAVWNQTSGVHKRDVLADTFNE